MSVNVFKSPNLNHIFSLIRYNAQSSLSKTEVLFAGLCEFEILTFTMPLHSFRLYEVEYAGIPYTPPNPSLSPRPTSPSTPPPTHPFREFLYIKCWTFALATGTLLNSCLYLCHPLTLKKEEKMIRRQN